MDFSIFFTWCSITEVSGWTSQTAILAWVDLIGSIVAHDWVIRALWAVVARKTLESWWGARFLSPGAVVACRTLGSRGSVSKTCRDKTTGTIHWPLLGTNILSVVYKILLKHDNVILIKVVQIISLKFIRRGRYHDSSGRLYSWDSQWVLHCYPNRSRFRLDMELGCLIRMDSRSQLDTCADTWWSLCGYSTNQHYNFLYKKKNNISIYLSDINSGFNIYFYLCLDDGKTWSQSF